MRERNKMVQQTFTDMEYANRKRITRREAFLDAMDSIIPWKEWMKLIAPFYVQKERGRKLIPLETMLRMYLMQNRFGLSDEGIEDAIYDSYAMKHFLKIDFSTEQTPRCHDISVLSSPARKARHHPQDVR